jgi:hypothetical protein
MLRLFGWLIVIALAWVIVERFVVGAPPPGAPRAASQAAAAAPLPPPPATCETEPAFAAQAAANATSETGAQWSVFGRTETGWEIYAPLVMHELGTGCPPNSQAFAAALAAWQTGHRMPASGTMDETTLHAFNYAWLLRRPFVAASAHCPAPPPLASLATADPNEGFGGKAILLRPGTLAAYRQMAAAARAESPAIAANPKLLTIFSGYRDPVADAADCALKLDCGTPARAGTCSAHRTGLAMDIYLGAAPGFTPASADDANRLYLSQTPAYQWMVANAARFGFAPYPFEPWHWEWTGEPP